MDVWNVDGSLLGWVFVVAVKLGAMVEGCCCLLMHRDVVECNSERVEGTKMTEHS